MRDLQRLVCTALSAAVQAASLHAAPESFARLSSKVFVRSFLFTSVLAGFAAVVCRAAGFQIAAEGE